MDKSLKRTLLALLVAGVLICACALVVSYLIMRSPERVTAVAEYQIHQYFGMPVSIAGSSIDLKKGPRVVLTSVRIDSPGELSIQVKKIYAYLSIWHLLFGDVKITRVRLSEPLATLNIESLKRLKSKGGPSERPALVVWNGSLKLIYKGKELDLKEVNGRIKDDRIDLRARTLGGRLLLEANLVKPDKAALEAYDIHIDQLGKGFKGTLRMSLSLENNPDGLTGSFLLETKGLNLPWTKKSIDKLTASITASGTKDRVNLTDITLKTPLVNVLGKGMLSGAMEMSSWPDAHVTLDMSSSEFDYDQVVALLPAKRLPAWLNTLLTSQIRHGRSRISTAQYRGELKGFFNGGTLLDNLHVVQDLNGQSFGAGYGPERVTGITGKVIYGSGDIKFDNLSGMMDKSRLDHVSLTFPKVVKPFLRVSVDVDLDMPASDFIRTWRAAMVPEDVYKLLTPVSQVESGQVRANMSAFYDESSRKPLRSKGNIVLSGCTYMWGTHRIIGQSGTISMNDYSSPLHIALSGIMESTRIKKLDMILDDPFGANRYRFTLLADHLPAISKFTMDNASLAITGGGQGPNLKGSFEINATGFTLFNSKYETSLKKVSASGEIKASLWPQSRFELTGVNIRMTSGILTGTARLADNTGSATITGEVRLDEIITMGAKGEQRLGGSVSGTITLSSEKALSMDGKLFLKDAVLPYHERLLIMNGPLTMSTSTISAQGFKIAYGDASFVMTGNVALQKTLHYHGNIAISGLKLGADGTAGLEIPDTLSADTSLTFTDCNLYGISIDQGKATAQLKQGILDLSNLELEAMSGSAKGSATIAPGGKSSFDIVLFFQNANLRKLLSAASSAKWWIDGDLDLQGHLFGNTDSLNGTLAINAKNGEIRDYRLISQIFSLLNVYKIIQAGDIDSMSSHFTYNSLSSTFTIKNSVLAFDDFALDSNSLQLSAVGTYSLNTRQVDAVLGVQPLESVDKTVSMVPLLGWVLTGDKGELIIVSMKVKGLIDNPSIQVAPVTTLSNTVVAPLLRTLKIPSHLIDESLKIIQKK